jgi:flagellar biosynthesis/type III secretory pathway protein FliH
LVREVFAGSGVKLSGSENLLDMKIMLATQFEAWKEQWVAEGEAKGLARGKVEGRVEGKAEALVCLLAERFGAVAPSWQKRIRGARRATLDRWFKRAIVAPDLRSVFIPPR